MTATIDVPHAAPGFPPNDRVSINLDSDGVAHVRLTRADKLNALDPAMLAALDHAGQALFAMPGLRCVVLSGEGRGFCAGLDLASMASAASADHPPLTQRSHGNANLYQQVAVQWRKLPVPVIAAIHGACLGGGLQIAGGADIRIVAPDASLAIMEMKWGLIPDMGGFVLWRGLVRADVLRELIYTHRSFTGTEAVAMGFATFTDADPLARATALARQIAQSSPSAIRAAKALANRANDLDFDEMLLAESHAQQRLLGTQNQIEALRSQIEGRRGEFSEP